MHPEAAFDGLCHADFVKSAEAVAPILGNARQAGVGETVLKAVRATREAVGKNTNLGIVLLLAPLAAVDPAVSLREGIGDVLRPLTIRDAELVYEAIRHSQAGGMGRVDAGDVADRPTGTLLEMMQLAADRDAVARQYATDFDLVLNFAVPQLAAAWPIVGRPSEAIGGEGVGCPEFNFPTADSHAQNDVYGKLNSGHPTPTTWETAVIRLHLELMARCPDTLIARKCGAATAAESARRAAAVLWSVPDAAGVREAEAFNQFDRWLRADGHRRNPGATADLVTAALFAALREGTIGKPAIV